NWMTTAQLLQHLTESCGMVCKGFVTGDWGPFGDVSDGGDAISMPTAEEMQSVGGVDDALAGLERDKALALEMIEAAGDRLDDPTTAPWDPRPAPLGQQLLGMIGHLNNHKGQLYYYLKLQGKPVNTMHYYGMA
ncbi:MAG: DinB family protein, partial [Gemmatimonadetes bacterium]|nr:DinB family protein [Gemmatimonadota bacterium]